MAVTTKKLAVVAFLLLACACVSTATRTSGPDPETLMNADRQFALDSAATGGAAWEKWFAEESIKPGAGGKWVIGAKAVGEQMTAALGSGVENGAMTLAWHPTHAQISRGGNLGTTWGRYTLTRKGVISEGTYVTVWEKQKDGMWKVLFDTGDPDPKP